MDPGSGSVCIRKALTGKEFTMPRKTIFEMKASEVHPLLIQKAALKKQDRLESAIDALRKKTGNKSVTLGFGKNEDIGIK